MQRKGSTFPGRRLLADRAGASFFNLQNFPGYGESTCSIIWFIVKMSKQTLCFHHIDKGIRISFFHCFPDLFYSLHWRRQSILPVVLYAHKVLRHPEWWHRDW